MKENYPSLKSIIKKIVINDIAINTVSGIATIFLLFISGFFEKSFALKYAIYGSVVLLPFYILHLLRIKVRISNLYLDYDVYTHTELKIIVDKLKKLIYFPYRTSFIVATIWFIGVIFTAIFSLYVLNTGIYTLFFTIFLILGIIPFIWLVEYIITKRSVIKLMKRYIEMVPEDYYMEIRGKGKSIVKSWTFLVSYLVFYTIFFMVTANFNVFKKVMNRHLMEIGNNTINFLEEDIDSLLFTDLSREDMSKYLDSLHLIGDAKVSVKLKDSEKILGSGIISKKIDEDILITRFNKEKGYLIYYYIPANYLKSYNDFLMTSLIFFMLLEFLILFVVVFQVGKEFKNEVRMVLSSTNKIANGDLSRGEIIYSQDEFGDLYGAIITVKNNTKAIVTKISNYSKKVSEVIQGVQDASDFLMRVSAHQDEMVNEAIESINYIDDFTEKLKNSTNTLANESEVASTTVTQFAVTITQVKESMHKLLRMAENSSSAILEMNSSISEISNNVSSLKEFGNEMDNTVANVREISEDLKFLMQEMLSITEETLTKSETSTEGVSHMIEIISISEKVFSKLSDTHDKSVGSLKEISSIIDLIDDYMDQTDVLALNAAIIAAQTDMKDKGIGVIADEIKIISEQINNATGNITIIANTAISKMKEQEDLSSQAGIKISKMKTQVTSNFENSKDLNTVLNNGKDKIKSSLTKIREQDIQTRNLLDKYKLFINQISSIYAAIEEQKRNSDQLAEISTEIKDMAEIVTNASREQTSGANQIATTSERINEFASNTSEAVGRLKDSLQKVLYLTSELNTNTLLSNSRSKELSNVVETVSNEMNHLKEEIRKFQI